MHKLNSGTQGVRNGEEHGLQSQMILASLLPTCEYLGKLLNLSEFPQLQSRIEVESYLGHRVADKRKDILE